MNDRKSTLPKDLLKEKNLLQKEILNFEKRYFRILSSSFVTYRNNKFKVLWDFLYSFKDRVNWDEFQTIVSAYKYTVFLNTVYWKVVAKTKKLEQRNTCQLCGKRKFLEVHHLSYEIFGKELFNMEKLLVVCRTCHQKLHN